MPQPKPRDRQEVTDEHVEDQAEHEESDLQPDPDEELDNETGDESDEDTGDTGDEDSTGDNEEETERPGEVRQRSRGQRDYGRLRARAREAEQRAERAEQALRERTTTTQPSQDQQRQQADARARELETARLESPEKYTEVALRHQREDFQQQLGMVQVSSTDAQDAARFDRLCARNPALNEIADDVERELANLRRQGGNMAREFIAKYILGDRALSRASRAKNKQVRNGQQQQQRERVRSTGGARSDVGRGSNRGGSEAQKRFDRIKDIPI